jgi:hypothetical protein
MKKVLVIALLALASATTFGQTVNGVPLKDIDVEYVEIVGTGRFLSTKVTIEIDFGQSQSIWNNKSTELKDVNGKDLKLNSMVDALNFMVANNYQFVTSYAITHGGANVYHFLLRKINHQKEASL